MDELMEHCHFVNGYGPCDPWPNCQCFYPYRVYVYNFVLKYFVKTVYFRKLSMIIIKPFENLKKKSVECFMFDFVFKESVIFNTTILKCLICKHAGHTQSVLY